MNRNIPRDMEAMRFRPDRVFLCMSILILALLCGHHCQAGSLLNDYDFEAFSVGTPGPWEFRYGHKGGTIASVRPRWHCIPRSDERAPERGTFLSVEKKGAAAGTVLIGQRITLPDPLPVCDLGIRYQAFCAGEDRSGIVALCVFTPGTWDSLPITADDATETIKQADIFQKTIQPQGDDTLQWTLGRVGGSPFRSALSRHAGKQVVVAVSFLTWHETTEEWARFDDLWLGEPLPHIRAEQWPHYIYRGEPVMLTVSASIGGVPPIVVLSSRRDGSEDKWITQAMTPDGNGLYRSTLSAEQTQTALEVRAKIQDAPGEKLETEAMTMKLTKRPEHPNLFYSPKELDRMRAKIGEFDWAKQVFDGIRGRAEGWLTKPFEAEVICGWWWHHYGCNDCGGKLNMIGPHEHTCRNCGKTWDNDILFHVYWSKKHGDYARAAQELSLTYQMTGDEKYARRAIEILLWYADHYADFPPSDKGGKVVSQTLDECVWLLQVMDAADLAYPVMSQSQARHIEQDLIYAGAQYTRKYRSGIHNIRCWHNSCWAAAGYFVGDPDMVDFARNNKYGFIAQMEQGVLEDGMWYERSMGYHSYTVSAILYQLKASMHAGDDLYKMPQVKKLLMFPIMIAFPNLVTPSLNDGGFSTRPINPNRLELAAAWYADPVAISALTKRYATGASRTSMDAWQFGEVLSEGQPFTPPPSMDLKGAGLAVLREGGGDDAICAMLEYGEHGGGHGHPDKLQLILYGLGKQLCPDLGTTGYANPLHPKYYKRTPAHNTVTIGGRDMAASSGELLDFKTCAEYSATVASANSVYDGYQLTRRVLLSENILVDEFIVSGKEEDVLDWFLRADGALTVTVPIAPITEEPLSAPYTYLKNLKAAETPDQWSGTWVFGKAEKGQTPERLVITMKGEPGTQVAVAQAPGGARLAQHWGTLRVRRKASSARFLAVYQLLRAGNREKPVVFAGRSVQVGERTIELGQDDTVSPSTQ